MDPQKYTHTSPVSLPLLFPSMSLLLSRGVTGMMAASLHSAHRTFAFPYLLPSAHLQHANQEPGWRTAK